MRGARTYFYSDFVILLFCKFLLKKKKRKKINFKKILLIERFDLKQKTIYILSLHSFRTVGSQQQKKSFKPAQIKIWLTAFVVKKKLIAVC